jgi:lauroyl/myristoyl acyltransferase
VSLRSRIFGRLSILLPNRKFETTAFVAEDVQLVGRGDETQFVRSNAVFVWSYYLRFARLAFRKARKRVYDGIEVLGEEHLRTAAAEEKGIILLSVHLGDYDAGGAWLAERRAITPVVIAQPLKPRWREALFSLVRRRCGVRLRRADATSLDELERDLQERRAVLIMLDRRSPGPASLARILGKSAFAPLAAGLLAARSQAPLLPAATWRDGSGGLVAWFGEPFTAAQPAQAMARISEVGEQLSALIRAHPEQWHVPANVEEMAWGASDRSSRHTAPELAEGGGSDGWLRRAGATNGATGPTYSSRSQPNSICRKPR